jgi:hypothetical protein
VIRALRVGVHARSSPDRLKAAQDLDVGSVIGLTHPLRELSTMSAAGARKKC